MKLSLRDRAFGHAMFSNNPMPPVSVAKHIEWDRTTPASEKTIYTDAEIFNAPDGAIAWLLEPIFERPDAYTAMMPAIEDNFKRAKEYYLAEDWLCENYPALMKELSL